MKNIVFLLIGNIRYDGRVLKEIKTLRKVGHQVTLIVSSFDKDDSKDNYDFDIVVLKRNNGGNFLLKFLRTFFYFFKMRKAILNLRPDMVHCNDLNTLFFIYGLPKKIEIVYDAHELYLESRKGFVRKFLSFWEAKLIKKAKTVIVPQIDRLYYMYFKYNLPLEQFRLIENFPLKRDDLSETFFQDKYGISTDNKTVITYLGAVTREREIDLLVQAMEKIDSAFLFIVGKGPDDYKREIEELICRLKLDENVFMMPPIPNKEVLDAVNSSDIGVCFYNEKHFNSYFCASNKLYEYLNLGVKVLTNNTAGVARVIKHGVNGYCCDVINRESVEEGLKQLVTMGEFERGNYYWDHQEKLFTKIYQ